MPNKARRLYYTKKIGQRAVALLGAPDLGGGEVDSRDAAPRKSSGEDAGHVPAAAAAVKYPGSLGQVGHCLSDESLVGGLAPPGDHGLVEGTV